ncbi:hypothetical protein P7K49_036333 [Saguinus oedipus]|uniref:Uncharacterized protein n=1 Tax=Saguinus oedipus TaxID=9490 RepID=A0ABQ9TJY0_SAGOE|nr:hypothetical protein P7K49_036333 [Saguinus oedipus]
MGKKHKKHKSDKHLYEGFYSFPVAQGRPFPPVGRVPPEAALSPVLRRHSNPGPPAVTRPGKPGSVRGGRRLPPGPGSVIQQPPRPCKPLL